MQKTMIYSSIRFDITLQIFNINIFWPQIQRKRCEEYNVFSYAFGCKKKALSDIFLPRGSSWSKHREASLNLQGFWSLWAYAHDFQRHLLSKLREWKLLSLYMFHRVTFILLIVSSLFLNLIAAQVVFSPTYNKTSHAGVLKMLRVNITWQNHK